MITARLSGYKTLGTVAHLNPALSFRSLTINDPAQEQGKSPGVEQKRRTDGLLHSKQGEARKARNLASPGSNPAAIMMSWMQGIWPATICVLSPVLDFVVIVSLDGQNISGPDAFDLM
jgi:hypothetical protein